MSKNKKNIIQKFYLHQQKWYAQWHTAAGVIAGSILIIVTLTGALLVYESELDVWLNPELFGNTQETNAEFLGFQEVYNKVKSQLPKDTVNFLSQDETRNQVFVAFIASTREQVIINPYTAEVMGRRVYNESLMGIIRNLHRTLLIPQVGKYLVGVSALMCLVLMITGLRLWIPKKVREIKRSFWINPKHKTKRINYDLHNVLGFYFSPFMSIIAVTGVAITFSQFVVLGLFLVSFSPPKSIQEILGQKSTYQADKATITINYIEKEVKKIKPNGKIRGFQLPKDSIDVITADVLEPTSFNQVGHRSRLSFDQYTGELLFNTDTNLPQTSRIYIDWLVPLHFGTFGGTTTRIIALITCLVMATLFITGLIIWIPRWRHNSKKIRKVKQEKVLATSSEV